MKKLIGVKALTENPLKIRRLVKIFILRVKLRSLSKDEQEQVMKFILEIKNLEEV